MKIDMAIYNINDLKTKYEIEDSASAEWNLMLLKVVNVLQVESSSVLKLLRMN